MSKKLTIQAWIMSNNYREIVKARRNKVSLLLAKSVSKPELIAEHLKESVDVIYKDIAHLKKKAIPWLDDLAFS
jgi:fibrillarin-like rRNA methylase